MARWIKFNKIIDKIHLIASMVMFSFLMMYIFTGIIKINHNLFEIPPVEESDYKLVVEETMDGTPSQYSIYLKEELDLKGREWFSKDQQENWIFSFNFPGDNIQITLTPAQDTLHVKRWTRKQTFFTVANRMHVLRGYNGGWEYICWAVMYDVSCFSMIIFALTGIMMWYRKRKRYKSGWWYLVSGILIPFGFIFLYVFWK